MFLSRADSFQGVLHVWRLSYQHLYVCISQCTLIHWSLLEVHVSTSVDDGGVVDCLSPTILHHGAFMQKGLGKSKLVNIKAKS